MQNYTVKVDWIAMQEAVVAVLKDDLKYLRKDLARVKKNKKGFVFSTDYKEDIIEINKRIEAMKLIIDYNGG